MSKRSLMLSTAAVALLTGAAFADTTIDSSKTEPYTTGALLSGQTGQANAGNITIKSGGSVGVSVAQGALTIDSNNWILQQATLTNKDHDSAGAIHVSLSADRNFSGATFTNAANATITGTGIYLDSTSNTSVSGSGTGKYGIFLDAAGCTTTLCTFNGNITLAANGSALSTLSVSGDNSAVMDISSGSRVHGNITFAGSATATSASTTQTATNMYGLYSAGTIDGNVIVAAGGQLAAYGQGAQAMYIAGGGVTGSIQIGGALTSSVVTKPITSYTQTPNTTTNPESGPALNIQASVGQGIAILGPSSSSSSTPVGAITMQGASSSGAAINIAPISGATSQLTIGVYSTAGTPATSLDTADPGFSFYNRGSVQAGYTNYNRSTAIMAMSGTSAAHTVLSGGFYNSGSMSAAVLTNGTGIQTTGVAALGIYIGDYAYLQAGTGKLGESSGSPGDQAAFVNSGSVGTGGNIQASVTGSRGGVAQTIVISSLASVPSIINTGTIAASATTTDAALSGNISGSTNPLAAHAIVDQSGSLTSIYNAGTISAVAGYQASGNSPISPLDNNSQVATAIDLGGGNDTTASGNGVTITNHSSGTRAAIIQGNIFFGTGDHQVLDLLGNGTHQAVVAGNVVFGQARTHAASGDQLVIGNFSTLQGAVITRETGQGGGIAVDVQSGGTLTLLNNSDVLKPMGFNCATAPQLCTLNATTFNVATAGTLNLGVNQSLATTGVVSATSVNLAAGADLGVTYASYLPQNANSFVLMTANPGQLHIDPATLAIFNNPANRPYLLAEATLCVTTTAGCAPPAGFPGSKDALVITVAPKTAEQIGLTAGSIALAPATTITGTPTTLFEQANIALGADNELGAAFINGVASRQQAQQAYNNMAPNLTGGTRAIAISITDQATGPVGARQRALRMYGKTSGEMTLWGQEFVQMIKDPGQGALDPNTGFKTQPGFRDHGFGFALGLDGGSPKYGWYGGALTFYAGDVNELSRNSHENQQWYLLSLYSSWRGTGLFLDTKLDAGYGHIDGKRAQLLAIPTGTSVVPYTRVAENKHAGALLSGGISTGAMFSYGAATLMPQLSLDGLYLREEGYTERNPGTTTVGDAFDLKIGSYNAKSLRAYVGVDARYDLELWDFYLQPEVRAGYRYDVLSDPVKLKMAFAYASVTNNAVTSGTEFTLTGPDPSQGNFVLGGTIAATTDAWTLGLNFDLVKGSNGAFQQIGTLHLLGRI